MEVEFCSKAHFQTTYHQLGRSHGPVCVCCRWTCWQAHFATRRGTATPFSSFLFLCFRVKVGSKFPHHKPRTSCSRDGYLPKPSPHGSPGPGRFPRSPTPTKRRELGDELGDELGNELGNDLGKNLGLNRTAGNTGGNFVKQASPHGSPGPGPGSSPRSPPPTRRCRRRPSALFRRSPSALVHRSQ